MKLEQYIDTLQQLVDKNPAAKDYTVIFSIDDEGNAFKEVHFEPSIGVFEEEDSEFTDLDSEDFENYEPTDVNAVCIN